MKLLVVGKKKRFSDQQSGKEKKKILVVVVRGVIFHIKTERLLSICVIGPRERHAEGRQKKKKKKKNMSTSWSILSIGDF
jgi:hypothetical protein